MGEFRNIRDYTDLNRVYIDSNLKITIEKMDDAATVNPAPASSNHQIETLGAELSANANNCQVITTTPFLPYLLL